MAYGTRIGRGLPSCAAAPASQAGWDMTLYEAFQVMLRAGYTQVNDRHSHHPKDIRDVFREAQLDLSDYTPDVESGEISQNHPRPSNHYRCAGRLAAGTGATAGVTPSPL
jgi:hypothetical protein